MYITRNKAIVEKMNWLVQNAAEEIYGSFRLSTVKAP